MASSLYSFSILKPSKLTSPSISTTKHTVKFYCSVITASPTYKDTSVSSLDDKFGSRKGIVFTETGNRKVPTVELTVRNGSSLRLQIPDGIVTSYKPKVYWKEDGFEELLYTIIAPKDDNVKGGIGLVMNDEGGGDVCRSKWEVKNIDNDSFDALQVELSCTNGTLEMYYAITLYPLSIATAITVKNNGRKPVTLSSAILSHLRFKKRNQTGIEGLKGCSYTTFPPLSSKFEILSVAEAMKPEDSSWFYFGSEPEQKQGEWKVQDVPITILKNRLSRVYTAPPIERSKRIYNSVPSKYQTIDQGKELMFRVIRMGYDDIYVSCPGSYAQKFGKDYFICTGPASMVVPVVVNPGEGWRGAQVIEHDNL